jgi:hypothetical protein
VAVTTKRKTLPAAKAGPEDAEQAALIRSLDAQRVKAELKTEARKIAETKTPERPAPPPEYGKHNSTLPVLPADETQTALHYLRTQGVPKPAVIVSWAILNVPEIVKQCVREYRADGSVRNEKFAPILAAYQEAHK